MQGMHTTTIMEHNERMLAATAATGKCCFISYLSPCFAIADRDGARRSCILCDLVFFFDDVRPPAVRVGCRYVIVRRTTMGYGGATEGFYVCRISTVV